MAEQRSDKFEEELKKLPASPGVYIMRDAQDTIIYVGKAVNLHNRVRSYFRKIVGRGPQIDRMVSQIDRFEYIVTDSELEALILENNLIKEHRPKYNTMLKDDKTYPYIKVTAGEPFPRIFLARRMLKDKARYFGPYTSSQSVRATIELLNRLYGLRDCRRVLPRDIGRERPCLNYHMDRCCGPCSGEVTQEAYRERVEMALSFLGGNYAPVLTDLQSRMEQASEAMEFEKAAGLRDLLQSVKQISQKQKMSENIGENKDILGISTDAENPDADGVVQLFFIRDGRLIGREHFYMTHVGGRSREDILSEFIVQFYAGTPFIPREIMLPCRITDTDLVQEWLSSRKGSKVTLTVPQRGRKEKLVELAQENAAMILGKDRERLKREEGRTIGAVKEIAQLLGLPGADRMEAYDISDISGFANVGSMVVYEKGKPKRSDYRKFRIRSVAGPNDYACMKEVLERRFRHGLESREKAEAAAAAEQEQRAGIAAAKEQEQGAGAAAEQEQGSGTAAAPVKDLRILPDSFMKFPDLLLMDGGRGQVNIALKVLDELGLDIPVCGMVKDDSHRTRGLYYHGREIPIDRTGEGFKLITRIQDEAHRFAITYHRSLRDKAQVVSRLDGIPGVGPARKKALMSRFGSIAEIAAADIDTLSKVPGIPAGQAEAIYQFFHKDREDDSDEG